MLPCHDGTHTHSSSKARKGCLEKRLAVLVLKRCQSNDGASPPLSRTGTHSQQQKGGPFLPARQVALTRAAAAAAESAVSNPPCSQPAAELTEFEAKRKMRHRRRDRIPGRRRLKNSSTHGKKAIQNKKQSGGDKTSLVHRDWLGRRCRRGQER